MKKIKKITIKMIHQRIKYPKFRQMSGFIREDTTLSQLLEEVKNITFDTIRLDPDFYNVVLYGTYPRIEEAQEFIEDLADGKPIRYYSLEERTVFTIVDAQLLITNNIEIIGKFDLLFMRESTNISTIIYNKIQTTTIYYKMKNNFRNSVSLTDKLMMVNYEEVPEKKLNTNILVSDVRIKDLNCRPNISFAKSLNIALRDYATNVKVKIDMVDKNKNNILVLCADNKSVEEERYIDYVKGILGEDINFDNSDVYFTGKDIPKEEYPYIRRGILEHITCDAKFDIIIGERFFSYITKEILKNMKDLLDERGMIIGRVDETGMLINNFDGIIEKLNMQKIVRGKYVGIINK